MKVILLKDVKNVGKKDQVVEVSDGYGNNFLIPRKLAVLSTSKSLEIRDQQKLDAALLEQKKKNEAEVLAKKIEAITVEFTAQTGKDGKMFGSISLKQIEQELKERHKVEIDKRKFIDHDAVNSLGYTRLKLELYKGVITTVNIHVSEKK